MNEYLQILRKEWGGIVVANFKLLSQHALNIWERIGGGEIFRTHPGLNNWANLFDKMGWCKEIRITLVNTQNVSVIKIVDSSSVQRAETKYGLRIKFLALVVTIHELWLNA